MPSEGSSSRIIFGFAISARNRQHLLFSARERHALLIETFLQAREGFGDLVDRCALLDLAAGRDQTEPQILAHGQAGDDAALLGHVSEAEMEALMRAERQQLPACEAHAACRLRHQAHHRPQCRRFAGTVAADQGDDLTPVHVQGDAVEDMACAIPGMEIVDFEQHGLSHSLHSVRDRPGGPPDCS